MHHWLHSCSAARRCWFAFVPLLLIIFLPLPAAQAGTTIVGTGQPQSCDEAHLRTAISGGGLIQFNCGGPVTIPISDDLVVATNTEIDGGGTSQGGLVTLTGQNQTRVLISSNGAHLTIRNLTIRNGVEPGADGRGGAIRGCWRCPVTVINSILRDNDGTAGNQEGGAGAIFVHETTLIVQDSLFTNNRGVNGGAINNLLSNLFVSGSTFTNNTATGYGGAIYTDGASWPTDDAIGGQLVIRTSTFNNNQASGQGGGAFLFAYPPDTITVDGVAFVGNTVSKDAKGDAFGGGLRVGNGDFSMSNTTFSANIARSQGGGLWRGELGRGTLTNVTFAGNQAVEDAATGKGGLGGAIAGGNWSCEHCTIANNHAGFQGGAIWGMGPSITLKQTIVANNTAFNDGQGWNVKNNCGSYPPAYATDGGNNFEFPQRNQGDASDYNCVAGISVADPQLGPLANNGGAVQTMALPIGSPALNIGTNCVATDARGIPRPQGTGCDAGAYELVERLTLNPATVFAGDPGFTLTIYGSGFSPTSQAMIGGVAHPSVVIDSVTIRVTITANEIATAGDLLVTISNSALPGTTLRVLPLATRIYLPLVHSP